MIKHILSLLVIAGTFAACGTAPDQATAPAVEQVTATESAYSWSGGSAVASGAYYCSSTGETWYIDQLLSQTIGRRCCGLSNNYKTDLQGAGNPATNTPYNRVALVCPQFAIPVSPTCGSSGQLCSTSTTTACTLWSRRANTPYWQVSGDLSAGLAYLPNWNPSKGLWELVGNRVGSSGNGDGMCPSFGPFMYFDFES